jgi:hypothetical protein
METMWQRKKVDEGREARSGRQAARKTPGAVRRAWNALNDPGRFRVLRVAAVLVATAAVAVGVFLGMRMLDRRVQALPDNAEPVAYRIKLADRAAWMPTALVRKIALSAVPEGMGFNDPALAERIHKGVAANPWVLRVVRVAKQRTDDPQMGMVEVYAEYRKPYARAGRDGKYFFVDAQGVRLPDEDVPRFQGLLKGPNDPRGRRVQYISEKDVPLGVRAEPIFYITIEGVAEPPPPPGRPWVGQDLYEGLRLAKVIAARHWSTQITAVDVRNYGGRFSRSQTHLAMIAQVGGERTQIRFGRFALPVDHEIPTEVKLANLDHYASEHNGRVAGFNSYVDLRYEQAHVSTH